MAQYLSPEWFSEMQAAAAAYVPDDASSGSVTLKETVTGSPFGDVSWVVSIQDGAITVDTEAQAEADVNFSQDYATAQALHQGTITTQEAFFAGRVRVAGHLNTLLNNADVLQGLAPAFASVRTATTY